MSSRSRIPTRARDPPQKEASALSSLNHPNIVTIFDVTSDEEGTFIVMEYVDGETLEDLINRGALPAEDFQRLAEQCLEALAASQSENLLHRDIKPTNVMVHWLPSGVFQVKMLDFGLAKFTQKPVVQTIDHGDSILGSIHFMAPEQFERLPLDNRTDMYSLGCVFYFALTQRYPFDGADPVEVMNAHLYHKVTNLRNLRPDLPRDVCDCVMWMVNRRMKDRPKHAREALGNFARAFAGQSVVVGEVDAGTHTSRMILPGTDTASQPLAPGASRASLHTTTHHQTVKRPVGVPLWAKLSFAALGLALVTIGVLFFHYAGTSNGATHSNGGGGDPGAGPYVDPKMPSASDADVPVTSGLIIHLDAAREVYADARETPAERGEKVAHWGDLAAAGGQTPAQYHDSGTPDKEERYPWLVVAGGPDDGTPREFAALEFDGDQTLVIRDKTAESGDPVEDLLSGARGFSLFVVAEAHGGGKDDIFTCRAGGRDNDFRLRWESGEGFAFGVHDGTNNPIESVAPAPENSFAIAAGVWDPNGEGVRLWVTDRFGKTVAGDAERGASFDDKIDLFRIGAHAGGTTNRLEGRVAEILLFDRPLSGSEREEVTSYLKKKYF
ncbi:MAG: protein kinase [Verrucomicrobiales bacterium]